MEVLRSMERVIYIDYFYWIFTGTTVIIGIYTETVECS